MTDPLSLFLSVMVSLVGAALFVYGRKQQRLPQILVGALMAIYPFFVSGAPWIGGIALGLVALLVVMTKLGL